MWHIHIYTTIPQQITVAYTITEDDVICLDVETYYNDTAKLYGAKNVDGQR